MNQQSHDPDKIVKRLTDLGHEWADKEGAASMLEETRKSLRSQIAVGHFAEVGAVNKCEMLAESTKEYVDHVRAMVDARKAANIAKVNYDAGRVWVDLTRTAEATKRAEMNMR